MRVVVGGAYKTVDSIKVCAGGVWKPVASTRLSPAGVWKVGEIFTRPLSLAITPATVSGSGEIGRALLIFTDAATATPTGGSAPYTYAWTRLTGSGAAFSPTAAATKFSATVPASTLYSGTFRCTVTDALGATAIASVSASFENIGI